MQIACDQCGTRYRIAPERAATAGRPIKLRCRRCGGIIVVPPMRAAEADAEARTEERQPLAIEAPVAAPEAAPAAGRLTGERNEASMLFSLAQLKSMAAPRRDGGSERPRRDEGSGLIDVRELAARTLAAVPAEPTREIVPSFVAAPPLSATLLPAPVAPALSSAFPIAPVGRSGAPWVWALVGALGALTVGISVVALVLNARRDVALAGRGAIPGSATPPFPRDTAPAATVTTTPAAASPAPVASSTKRSPGALDNSDSPAAHAPAVAPASAPAGGRQVAARAGRVRASSLPAPSPPPLAATRRRAVDPPATAAPVSRAASERAPRDDDELGRLLGRDDGAGSGRAPEITAGAAPAASLPERLDNVEIVAAMRAIKPRVDACFAEYHVPGVATVRAVIGGAGRIQSLSVIGDLSRTPSGECVARAVRGASFKRFRAPSMSIEYPFLLR